MSVFLVRQLLWFNRSPSAFPTAYTVAITAHFWTVTFAQEVNLFWRGRITGATIMFLLNRYIGLLYNILNVIIRVSTLSDKVRVAEAWSRNCST